MSKKQLGFRFLMGFTASNISFLLSYISVYASGVALAFPAIGFTALVSLWIRQGETVAMSAATPMLVGSTSSGIFAILFVFLHPILLVRMAPHLAIVMQLPYSDRKSLTSQLCLVLVPLGSW